MITDLIARAEAWLAARHSEDESAAIIRDLLAEVARLTDVVVATAQISSLLADAERDRDAMRDALMDVARSVGVDLPVNDGESVRDGWARWAAATIERTSATPLTVGAALALPQVQDGSHVVEYMGDVASAQLGCRGARVLFGGRWGRDRKIWIDEYAMPCRLVPVDLADDDPSTRGPL